jgi:hypothetical protein
VAVIDVDRRTTRRVRPTCCRVMDSFVAAWSDEAEGNARELIERRLPVTTAAAGNRLLHTRGWMCVDWLIRVHTPAWLEVAGHRDIAASLRRLPEIRERAALERALAALDEFREWADTSWDAACATADAGPAWEAEVALAWETARDSAWDPSWRAAWEAAHEPSLAGTARLLEPVLQAARHAARDAAFEVLRTRPEELSHVIVTVQDSSLELLDRMIRLRSIHPTAGGTDTTRTY